MDTQTNNRVRQWKILYWNIRGINSTHKWTTLRSKIVETGCDIIYIQETKRELFDQQYLRNFCLAQFDCFRYIPSLSLSGGTIIVWKSSRFTGHLIFQNDYAMSIKFVSMISGAIWVLTNIYAPCTPEGKQQCIHWFHNIDMAEDTDWLIVGDFNLIRRPSDRNNPRVT